jgi:hypothetical protein
VKVYHPKENTYAWVDELLVTYADPLLALDKVRKGNELVLPKEMPVSYFKPLIGTRHTYPENGLLYETSLPLGNRLLEVRLLTTKMDLSMWQTSHTIRMLTWTT